MIPILQIVKLSQVTKARLEHRAFLKTCSPNYYDIISRSFGNTGLGRGRVSLWGVVGTSSNALGIREAGWEPKQRRLMLSLTEAPAKPARPVLGCSEDVLFVSLGSRCRLPDVLRGRDTGEALAQ